MLDAFIVSNREAIIAGARARVESRGASGSTEVALTAGIPVFLTQLGAALRWARSNDLADHAELELSARQHGKALFRTGLSIGQVVHDYGDVCQVITELAVLQEAPISGEDFQLLNLCLDDAIAGAVTEWARLDRAALAGVGTERLGLLAHELRNLLGSATLAYESLKRGRVAIAGSTGQLLGRSLTGLRDLVDRSLADVRLHAGLPVSERILVAELVAEIAIGAGMDAEARGLHFSASSVERTVAILGDRQILAAAVSNLIQNALKFTPKGGTVSLTTHVDAPRVLFDVEDECGGLPQGAVDELFAPYSQRGGDRTGVGLGLHIALMAAKAHGGAINVRDLPGEGCVFSLSLPLEATEGPARG